MSLFKGFWPTDQRSAAQKKWDDRKDNMQLAGVFATVALVVAGGIYGTMKLGAAVFNNHDCAASATTNAQPAPQPEIPAP